MRLIGKQREFCRHCGSEALEVTGWEEEKSGRYLVHLRCKTCKRLLDVGRGEVPDHARVRKRWIRLDSPEGEVDVDLSIVYCVMPGKHNDGTLILSRTEDRRNEWLFVTNPVQQVMAAWEAWKEYGRDGGEG